jgi:hypothetical protein
VSDILKGFGTLIVMVQLLSLLAASPAAAISVELAKKCREMAIKAHPPQLAGTKPYAQAERDVFHECVAKNGQMNVGGAPKAPSPGKD